MHAIIAGRVGSGLRNKAVSGLGVRVKSIGVESAGTWLSVRSSLSILGLVLRFLGAAWQALAENCPIEKMDK